MRAICPAIALCVSLSLAGIRVVLKDGTAVEGEKKSENMNFLVLDAGGSPVSILKTIIDTIITPVSYTHLTLPTIYSV